MGDLVSPTRNIAPPRKRDCDRKGQDAIKSVLLEAITMDGRGSWRDNVFLERFWRSVKYFVDAVMVQQPPASFEP